MVEAVPTVSREDLIAEPVSEVGLMSQWKLMSLRFRRNKLAMIGLVGLLIMYTIMALAPFLSANDYRYQDENYVSGPPTPIVFHDQAGNFTLRPHIVSITTDLDPVAFKFVFTRDDATVYPIEMFVRREPYKLLGFIKSDLHLFGVSGPTRVYLFGADPLGRDMMARVLQGGQISMTVGLLGVAMSIVFGSIMGTASGYYGGFIDDIMQRIIEIIASFPTVPLWAALAAALPTSSSTFTPLDRYFLITVILSLVNWTGLARQLRGKVMSYSNSDFVMAALASGANDRRIIFVHMLPNAASHIIVVAALAIPGMILGETQLSFLGLGILPPLVSWGALLKDAQQVSVVIQQPWLVIPGVAVIITVLLFSFLGDGLRDAVDPYSI